ncbi:MAG: hypothetical protein KF902_11890 [Phycisphaeraceae bacterium]|nr:hypothetical protein [Phycisphaeraceae bacterium]
MLNHPFLAAGRAVAIATPALGLTVLALSAPAAHAQFTVINLHQSGASHTMAFGGSGAYQVGNSEVGATRIASMWSGDAASHLQLPSPGFNNSAAFGAWGNRQVGYIGNGSTVYRAALWNGPANPVVDLHPGGSISAAFAVHGNQQVGAVSFGFVDRASIWHGTAESWLNVHPGSFASSSSLAGTSGDQQVGQVRLLDTGAFHASLWTGTADSWVDLNPDGAFESRANAVSGGQQVGMAYFPDGASGPSFHASTWNGTADSWVDLHPDLGPDGGNSEAYDVLDGMQVGMATVDFHSHASFWSGTADSWVDLHTFLPPEFLTSSARSISRDGAFIYIAGVGYNSLTEREEALLWTQQIPAPAAMTLLSLGGLLTARRRR